MNQLFTSFQEFRHRYPIRPNDDSLLLGSGSYGKVIKVEDQVETEWVAVKISEFKGNDPKSLKAEVELAKRVPRQANIARYDACYRLETDTSVSDFAIMKYYPDGNLADLLKRGKLTPEQIHDLTRGILLGLQHLHRNRIVHRDFKPANILISRDNQGRFVPKIADFGLSKLVSDDEIDSSDFDLSDGRGTPSYKAPEQIEGSRVSFNLDLWAFGVILYEIITGEKPFASDSRVGSEQVIKREIEKKIITVALPKRVEQLPEPYRTMIKRCLVKDIHKRVRKEEELLALLEKVSVTTNLTQADKAFQQQQYLKAKTAYEQVLQGDPMNETALRGITQCLDALRPLPLVSVLANETDLRPEPLGTDIFEKPQPTGKGHIALPEPIQKPSFSTRATLRIGIPVVAVVIGVGLAMKFIGPATPTPTKTVPTTVPTNLARGKTISQPIRQPFSNQLTIQKTAENSKLLVTKTAFPATMSMVAAANLPKQDQLSGQDAGVQQLADAQVHKQKAQTEYDALINEGVAAIDNGNNKLTAMATFAKARELATGENLNTDKAIEKYAVYLTKADRIFQREEYEGAKSWYLVAQALINTSEVRTRIKECEKNL